MCERDRSSGHGKAQPNALDRHVGTRVQLRRVILGMSLEQVAAFLQLTPEQLSARECGAVRIEIDELSNLSEHLGVPMSWFFEHLEHGTPALPDARSAEELKIELLRIFDAMGQDQRLALLKLAYIVCSHR